VIGPLQQAGACCYFVIVVGVVAQLLLHIPNLIAESGSAAEVVRRWVGRARRCSKGSVQKYGSVVARAGQKAVNFEFHHPRLASVHGRKLRFGQGLQDRI
jgi:hypothetical protein